MFTAYDIMQLALKSTALYARTSFFTIYVIFNHVMAVFHIHVVVSAR